MHVRNFAKIRTQYFLLGLQRFGSQEEGEATGQSIKTIKIGSVLVNKLNESAVSWVARSLACCQPTTDRCSLPAYPHDRYGPCRYFPLDLHKAPHKGIGVKDFV